MSNIIKLTDRIKELTFTTGTGIISLAGPANGFSSFSSEYNHGDVVFYAITDGQYYEVGSGLFTVLNNDLDDTEQYALTRASLKSSNEDDSNINFTSGPKEVFVTYPATHCVFHASGYNAQHPGPQSKGIVVWDSNNIVNYYPDLKWDNDFKSLSLQKDIGYYGIDVGGDAGELHSRVRASGYYVGEVGVYFQEYNGNDFSYPGGFQYKHFLPNETDVTSYSNLVFDFDGVVQHILKLKQQSTRTVFAGPIDDCAGGCPDGYPTFRLLDINDIPDLSSLYTTLDQLIATSGDIITHTNTVIASSGQLIQDGVDAFKVLVSGDIATLQQEHVEHFEMVENELDLFRDLIGYGPNGCSSGICTIVSGETIPAISANDVYYHGFTVSGVSGGMPYVVNISPSGAIADKVLLTYAFASDVEDHKVSGVFYNPLGTSSSEQVLNFNISVKRVMNGA